MEEEKLNKGRTAPDGPIVRTIPLLSNDSKVPHSEESDESCYYANSTGSRHNQDAHAREAYQAAA